MYKYKKNLLILLSLVLLTAVWFLGPRVWEYFYHLRIQSFRTASMKISAEEWDKKYQNIPVKDRYKVIYITCSGGEYSAAEYFKYAAEKKGWSVKIFHHGIYAKEEEFLKFDPDIVIVSWFVPFGVDDRIISHRSKKYLWISLPLENAYKTGYLSKTHFLKLKSNLKLWLGIAHGLLLTPEDEMLIYKEIWEDQLGKEFNGIRMLPLTPSNTYSPAEPKKLSWASLGWDKYRSSNEYKKFITALSENVPMKVYGPYNVFSYLKDGIYGGYIPPGLQNIEALRKNGIYLLTHSNFHNNANVPSMRPFEAAAANVITISDKNPFVMKHFGDSMLYFDHNANSEEMYRQVKAHIDWVFTNPELAKAKAAAAHEIFLRKFTVEHDFIRIAKMHEYVLTKEKKQKHEIFVKFLERYPVETEFTRFAKMHEYILAQEKKMNLDYSLSYALYQAN